MTEKRFTDINEARKEWVRLSFEYEKVFNGICLSEDRSISEVIVRYSEDKPHKRNLEEVVELIEHECVNAMTKHMLHLFAEEYMKESKETNP